LDGSQIAFAPLASIFKGNLKKSKPSSDYLCGFLFFLLVAATNLDKILDNAVWRRFDDAIEVPKPSEREIKTILKQTLSSVAINFIDWISLIQQM